jgi:hypothetical protein
MPQKQTDTSVQDKQVSEYEDRLSLLNFFKLLLKIDKRVNPHKYTNKSKSK